MLLLWHINYSERAAWSAPPPAQLPVNANDSESCFHASRFDRAATHSAIPDLDHPNMYTRRLHCSLEGLICIFIRKKRKLQIFCGASREWGTKSLSPRAGAIEQNIYFVFIPFLNCVLMCKSELPFQQGKSGFNVRPKIRLAQSELSARISSGVFCCCCFFK